MRSVGRIRQLQRTRRSKPTGVVSGIGSWQEMYTIDPALCTLDATYGQWLVTYNDGVEHVFESVVRQMRRAVGVRFQSVSFLQVGMLNMVDCVPNKHRTQTLELLHGIGSEELDARHRPALYLGCAWQRLYPQLTGHNLRR